MSTSSYFILHPGEVIFFLNLFLLIFTFHHYFLCIYLSIYLFMAALGLHCCMRAFSSCGERGLLFVAVHGLLIVVASLCCGARALGVRVSVVVARALECRLSTCGAWA